MVTPPHEEPSPVETALRLIHVADELQAAGRREDADAVRAGASALVNGPDSGQQDIPNP
jgi:hypothetical protein